MSGAGRPPRVQPQSPEGAPRATEPYGSIVERFHGTEWDTRPSPEPPRSPLSGILVVVGAVALLVIGVFVVVAVLSRPSSAVVTPSRLIATPQPTPGPDDLLLTAFWSEVGRPTFSYHLTIDAAVTDGKDKATESLALDVYADDFTGTADLSVKGILQPTHLVLLRSSGILYLKHRGDATWTTALTAGQIELHVRPFLNLDDPRQLIVSGTATRSGVTLQRLVSTDLYRAPLNRLLPIAIGSIPTATTVLEVLVTTSGIPVSATFTVHVPADLENGEPAIDGIATYSFTRVDQVDPIPSPSL